MTRAQDIIAARITTAGSPPQPWDAPVPLAAAARLPEFPR
jgi:hypothetical protein